MPKRPKSDPLRNAAEEICKVLADATDDPKHPLHGAGTKFKSLRLYRLDGKIPVRCETLEEWATVWDLNTRVRLTQLGPFRVSTVFLGIDHRWWKGGPPLLFETMTFWDHDFKHKRPSGEGLAEASSEYGGRWSTWEEAEAAHDAIVGALKAEYCEHGEEPVEITGEEASTRKHDRT